MTSDLSNLKFLNWPAKNLKSIFSVCGLSKIDVFFEITV